jgi:hypothetical protein
MKPIVASERVLMKGGYSAALPGNGFNRTPKNAAEKQRRRKKPPKIAATAEAVTDAERFEGVSIECLYTTSSRHKEERRENATKEKLSLTFAFFSPKVPVEKFGVWRRAHGTDQAAKRSPRLSRLLRNQARLRSEL